MSGAAWQDPDVAGMFVEERRAAIPFGSAQIEMMLRLVDHFRPAPARVVDLGCGDGILARTLLAAHPDATAALADYSEPMLERARIAMAPYAARCEIRWADLREPILGLAGPGSVDVVVSGYAIHHLPHERKSSLYGEIFELLAPGGLFVNVEHVASATAAGEALFDERYIAHMAALSGRGVAEVSNEYHGRPDKADNILAPVGQQLAWLRDIGFRHVDCYFKWLELAVFGGVKPGGPHPGVQQEAASTERVPGAR